jgi:hypothetical protein
MGKGGCNSDIAVDIANHCAFQAQLGRSDLGYEKRLVKRVYRMCYGCCGESDDSDDEYDDDYEIPKEIKVCMRLTVPTRTQQEIYFRTAWFTASPCSRGLISRRYARS